MRKNRLGEPSRLCPGSVMPAQPNVANMAGRQYQPAQRGEADIDPGRRMIMGPECREQQQHHATPHPYHYLPVGVTIASRRHCNETGGQYYPENQAMKLFIREHRTEQQRE